MDPPKPTIRWLIRRDMPEVLRIDWESFDVPWGEDDFILTLRERNVIGLVAELDGVIAGYIVYALELRSLDVLNLAVHRNYTRTGIGTVLVDRMKEKLVAGRTRTQIITHVRETNLDAQLFFSACGFLAVRVLKNFYDDAGEAAYQMVFTEDGLAARREPRNRIEGME